VNRRAAAEWRLETLSYHAPARAADPVVDPAAGGAACGFAHLATTLFFNGFGVTLLRLFAENFLMAECCA